MWQVVFSGKFGTGREILRIVYSYSHGFKFKRNKTCKHDQQTLHDFKDSGHKGNALKKSLVGVGVVSWATISSTIEFDEQNFQLPNKPLSFSFLVKICIRGALRTSNI
jgi:hypothetical protein